jgi:hypothetical protein
MHDTPPPQDDPNPLEPLSATLARVFAGPRGDRLTLGAFLAGLHGRAYPFAVMAIDLPNCIPTGIPWLSTLTGVPIVLLLIQQAMRLEVPSLPNVLARQALPRGKLQDFYARSGRWLVRLERHVRPRHRWLLDDVAGIALFVALFINAVVLALPIPFANLFPAWAVMFFAAAQLERDGLMAALGWVMTVVSALWTVGLLLLYGQATMIGWDLIGRIWAAFVG